MQLVQYFSDGTISLNWEQLPDNFKKNTLLRDKIFNELKAKVSLNQTINSRILYDLNRYVSERLKTELKK